MAVTTPLDRTLEEIERESPEVIQAAILALSGALQAVHPRRVRLLGPLSPPTIVRAAPYNSVLLIKLP